jgi:hypothetical protein
MSLPTPPAGNPNDDLLRNLVDAMRRVAEEARDGALARLRESVAERTEQLKERDTARIAELREKAAQEISGIGEWERGEIERVRQEAVFRVEARQRQLEEQLAGMSATVESEVASIQARVAAYESEIGAFFGQLSEIDEPAAFAAAAKRMPHPPSLDEPQAPALPAVVPAEGGAASDGATAEAEAAAQADAPAEADVPADALADADGEAAEQPPGRDAELAAQLAELDAKLATAETNGGEVTTSILVTGLGSFGAITSFKQALERADGVRNVSLGLAPAGEEFVYRATHAPGLDLPATIRAIEGEGTEIRETDGALRVLVSHTG